MTKQNSKMDKSLNNSETPSVDDILQSIRGVISDNESYLEEKTYDLDGKKNYDEADVLQLTDLYQEPSGKKITEQHSIITQIDNSLKAVNQKTKNDDLDLSEYLEISAIEAKNRSNQKGSKIKTKQVPNLNDSLISDSVKSESKKQLKGLINNFSKSAAFSKNSSGQVNFRNGTSLEDLVIETMKPLLSEWLNTNLPVIIKQIVEKEIKKLIPKDD